MPSNEGARVVRNPATVDVSPGQQALVLTPSMQSPLAVLPDEAFENLLVVSVTRPPEKVERTVRDAGGDPNRVGVVPVSGSPVSYDGPMWTADAVTPADLSGINDQVRRACRYVKPGTGWVVLDNVNVLLMYAETSGVLQLVQSVLAQSRGRNAHGVFALVPDAVSRSTFDRFEGAFDRTLDRTDVDD